MEIILSIGIIALAILGMAVGVILNNKPLKGSCGGQDGKIIVGGVEITCPSCRGDSEKCKSQKFNPELK